jgi:protein-tyrosine phosphatase
MVTWVIPFVLARSSRPGYWGERATSVSQAEVDEWLADIKQQQFRSIICLLADDQLSYYSALPIDLVTYYRQNGFEVEHLPARDHQHPPLSEEQLEKVWAAFERLSKPILVHCSAGIDRTGAAIRYIQAKLSSSG